jgi:recombination protein RecA
MTEKDDKKRALELALARRLKSNMGKGAMMKLGDRRPSRGCAGDLQRLVGPRHCFRSRGLPSRGRVIEIFGPESSGKTTLTLHCHCRSAQKTGGVAAFIDAEHALDLNYAKKLGVQSGRSARLAAGYRESRRSKSQRRWFAAARSI